MGKGRVHNDTLLVLDQRIKGITTLTSYVFVSPSLKGTNACPLTFQGCCGDGSKQQVCKLCVNCTVLDLSQGMVGLTRGLSKNSLNARPCACSSSDKPSAWLTCALLNVVHHDPRHGGDVHVRHLGAQGDLPEVSGAAAVAAPVPSVLLSGRARPKPMTPLAPSAPRGLPQGRG